MIKVTVKNGTMPQEEMDAYIFYTKKRYGTIMPDDLEIILEMDGEYVNITYDPPFRLCAYRATDYLVNDPAKLNPSKFAEMQDKVPNTLS